MKTLKMNKKELNNNWVEINNCVINLQNVTHFELKTKINYAYGLNSPQNEHPTYTEVHFVGGTIRAYNESLYKHLKNSNFLKL